MRHPRPATGAHYERRAAGIHGPRWLFLVWGAGVAVAVAGAAGIAAIAVAVYCEQWVQMDTLDDVALRTELAFPAGTRLMEAKYQPSAFPTILAKVEMPARQVEAFFRQKPFCGRTSRSVRWVRDSMGLDVIAGWHPDGAEQFLSAHAYYDTGGLAHGIEALADLDRPRVAVLYLHWMM